MFIIEINESRTCSRMPGAELIFWEMCHISFSIIYSCLWYFSHPSRCCDMAALKSDMHLGVQSLTYVWSICFIKHFKLGRRSFAMPFIWCLVKSINDFFSLSIDKCAYAVHAPLSTRLRILSNTNISFSANTLHSKAPSFQSLEQYLIFAYWQINLSHTRGLGSEQGNITLRLYLLCVETLRLFSMQSAYLHLNGKI